MNEVKRDRFVRIAEERTQKVLDDLRSLSKCAARESYEYSAEDVEKILSAIVKELESVRDRFAGVKKFTLDSFEPEKSEPEPKRISIDLGYATLVAEKGSDPNYKEMFIGLEDDNGIWLQDLAVVGGKYHYEHDQVVLDTELSVKVYSDRYNEDYTHDFTVELYEPYIDYDKVSFKDFDVSGEPLEIFFDYNGSKKELGQLVSSLGYRVDLCENVVFCMSVLGEESTLAAEITFKDQEKRWVDLSDRGNYLDKLIHIVEQTDTEHARAAMDHYHGRGAQPDERRDHMSIDKDKLQKYLDDEMILEFDSAEECMKYFNTYDSQKFASVEEMKAFQGEYGFGIGSKWYHISYQEALDVWKKPSLSDQIKSASSRAESSAGQSPSKDIAR